MLLAGNRTLLAHLRWGITIDRERPWRYVVRQQRRYIGARCTYRRAERLAREAGG